MTPDSALDTAIRQARHLLFAFDGPIRSVYEAKLTDSAAVTVPTSAYLHETLAACRESGRSVAVISAHSPTEVRDYLDAHDLSNQVAVVAASIGEAASALEASPADCLLITSSPADIEAARAAGTPTIGYARTTDAVAYLVGAGVIAFVYSMADLTLSLRASCSPPLPT
jgi:beta-phosphoglucomutase-like phosphatase (HAD superfamily)